MGDRHAIVLGNLRNDCSEGKLRQFIKEMFDCMGIPNLRREQIVLHCSHSGNLTAVVLLKSHKRTQGVLERLRVPDLQIQSRIQNISRGNSPVTVDTAYDEGDWPLKAQTNTQYTGPSTSNSYNTQNPNHSPDASFSGHDIAVAGTSGTISYTVGEYIGTEDRHHEFKLGQGGYLAQQFQSDLQKYVCGFLNSEGGSLYIGVNDSGEVAGISCNNREEDKLRQAIDQTLRDFKPIVLPEKYTVHFFPVLNRRGCGIANTKVIKVIVHPTTSTRLFETQTGEVYMRRDGSTERMKPHAIQDWTQQQKQVDVTYKKQIHELQKQQLDLAVEIKKIKVDRAEGSAAPSHREIELENELKRITKSHENLMKSHEQVLAQLSSQQNRPVPLQPKKKTQHEEKKHIQIESRKKFAAVKTSSSVEKKSKLCVLM